MLLTLLTCNRYSHSLLSFLTRTCYSHSLLVIVTRTRYSHSLLTLVTRTHYSHNLLTLVYSHSLLIIVTRTSYLHSLLALHARTPYSHSLLALVTKASGNRWHWFSGSERRLSSRYSESLTAEWLSHHSGVSSDSRSLILILRIHLHQRHSVSSLIYLKHWADPLEVQSSSSSVLGKFKASHWTPQISSAFPWASAANMRTAPAEFIWSAVRVCVCVCVCGVCVCVCVCGVCMCVCVCVCVYVWVCVCVCVYVCVCVCCVCVYVCVCVCVCVRVSGVCGWERESVCCVCVCVCVLCVWLKTLMLITSDPTPVFVHLVIITVTSGSLSIHCSLMMFVRSFLNECWLVVIEFDLLISI